MQRRLDDVLREIEARQAEADQVQAKLRRLHAREWLRQFEERWGTGGDGESVEARTTALRHEVEAAQAQALTERLRALQQEAAELLTKLHTA